MTTHIPLQQQLNRLVGKGGKFGGKGALVDEDLDALLYKQAQLLLKLIQDEINKLYSRSGMFAGWYSRTGNFKKSVYIEDINPVTGQIKVGFNEFALHQSALLQDDLYYVNTASAIAAGANTEDGYVPTLMNYGFKILFAHGKRYPATHFFEKAIVRFMRQKDSRISLETHYTSYGGSGPHIVTYINN
jgi:hypothetical protein